MKRYSTIVADPPWEVKRGPLLDCGHGFRKNGPAISQPLAYPTMTLAEIADLPVRSLAADDAHLYLWTINRYIDDAYDIARAWGFKPSTLITWAKEPMGSGLGGAWGITTEHALFCRRGTLAAKAKIPTTWFKWKRPYELGRHSAKPDAFLDLVEQVSPGPYCELFARRARFGWDYWGNQSLGTRRDGSRGRLMDPFRLFGAPVYAIAREVILPFLAGLGAVLATGVAGAVLAGSKERTEEMSERGASIHIGQLPSGYWTGRVEVRIPSMPQQVFEASSFHNAREALDWARLMIESTVAAVAEVSWWRVLFRAQRATQAGTRTSTSGSSSSMPGAAGSGIAPVARTAISTGGLLMSEGGEARNRSSAGEDDAYGMGAAIQRALDCGEAHNHEAEIEAVAWALQDIARWAEYGYQDLNSGGVLSCVKARAWEALDALDAVRRSPQDEDHEAGIDIEHLIACELDKPSVYMGGPTQASRRQAKAIMAVLSRCPSPERNTEKLVEALREVVEHPGASTPVGWKRRARKALSEYSSTTKEKGDAERPA